jgi:uncharacterized repeat protein (TIGR02543 family)
LKDSVVWNNLSGDTNFFGGTYEDGHPGEGEVGSVKLNARIDNVAPESFQNITLASGYLDTNTGLSGYAYFVQYYEKCELNGLYYFVGSGHTWLGTTDGNVGSNEFHPIDVDITVTLYNIVPNTYKVTYDGNGATSNVPGNQNFIFNSGDKISSTIPVKTGYKFLGWKYNDTISFNPGDMIPNGWGDFTLIAQWKKESVPSNYLITFDPQGGTVSPTTKSIQSNEAYGILPTPVLPGYKFLYWTTKKTPTSWNYQVDYFSGYGINNTGTYKLTSNQILYAQWVKIVTVTIDLNGGKIPPITSSSPEYTGTFSYVDEVGNESSYYKVPVKEGYKFAGFSMSAPLTLYDSNDNEITNAEQFRNSSYFYFNQPSYDVTLKALWDAPPVLYMDDLYVTLKEAQSGFITTAKLLENVYAVDDIDGNISNKITVQNYDPGEFSQFTSDGSSVIIYQVIDSAGNVTTGNASVYIADTTPVVIQDNSYVRFINEQYYQKSYEEGGLENTSLWKTDPEYAAALEDAMQNRKSLTYEKGSVKILGIDYEFTKPGSISQDHIYETWTFTADDIKKIKEYINAHGFGNFKEENGLKEFINQFNYCKT